MLFVLYMVIAVVPIWISIPSEQTSKIEYWIYGVALWKCNNISLLPYQSIYYHDSYNCLNAIHLLEIKLMKPGGNTCLFPTDPA